MGQLSQYRIGYLDIEESGHVATITMRREQKLNAMTAGFWTDLREALDRLSSGGDIRAVIITGGGSKAFSAGGDIDGFLDLSTIEEMRNYQQDALEAFSHVEQCPLIVIAAINGLAYGGGCELALACDFVIATDTATFALPESALGLVPGFGVLRAPEVMGRQMSKYLIATGEALDSQQAFAAGLVQLVVPQAELMDRARAIAAKVATRSPNAVSVAKRMINSTIDMAGLDMSVKEVTALQASDDRARGIRAFLAKSQPEFNSRLNSLAK